MRRFRHELTTTMSKPFLPGLIASEAFTRNGGRHTTPRSVPLSLTRAMPTSLIWPSRSEIVRLSVSLMSKSNVVGYTALSE